MVTHEDVNEKAERAASPSDASLKLYDEYDTPEDRKLMRKVDWRCVSIPSYPCAWR